MTVVWSIAQRRARHCLFESCRKTWLIPRNGRVKTIPHLSRAAHDSVVLLAPNAVNRGGLISQEGRSAFRAARARQHEGALCLLAFLLLSCASGPDTSGARCTRCYH